MEMEGSSGYSGIELESWKCSSARLAPTLRHLGTHWQSMWTEEALNKQVAWSLVQQQVAGNSSNLHTALACFQVRPENKHLCFQKTVEMPKR